MRTNNIDDNEENQIDLLELFYKLKQKLWLIILIAVLTGGSAGAYSRYIIPPQYRSTAMIYVLSKKTIMTSMVDLQIGSQLTKDYKIMVTSRPVLEEVVESLGLNMTYKDLRNKISVTNPTDTRILSLAVQDSDPVRAEMIVNKIASTASDYMGNMMEMVSLKIIEEGEIPSAKTSPDIKKNVLMGAVAGVFLICTILAAGVIMDDTIRTEEDVERYLGVSVLVAVPSRKGESVKKIHKSGKKKVNKKEGGERKT